MRPTFGMSRRTVLTAASSPPVRAGRGPEPPGVAAVKAGACWPGSLNESGVARRAGAPSEKSAGIDLFKQRGDAVEAGEPLYRIHAAEQADLAEAAGYAERGSGFEIAAS